MPAPRPHHAPSSSRPPRSLWESFFSFGAIQGALIFLPLLAFPYLARVLQPEAFGQVMYLLVLAQVISLCVEWGFALSSVRDVATNRDNPPALTRIVHSVLSAKCMLALLCIAVLAGAKVFFPHWGGNVVGFACAVGYGVLSGFNPTWYYQGKGQGMRTMALWDVGSSVLALAGMFVVVHQPQHGFRYLLLLLLCKGACYGWLNMRLWQHHSPPRPSFSCAWAALIHARVFFYARLSSMLYTQANTLLLGNVLAARDMGLLIAADKIAKAVVSLSSPITQTLFPEVCALHHHAPHTARRYLRLSFLFSALGGVVAGVLLWLLAPWVIRIALGPDYAAAVPVLRITCLVIPFLACNFVLGTQTLVPFGQEAALVRVLFTVGLCSLPCVALLGLWGGLMAAAYMPVLVEGSIFALLGLCVAKYCPQAFWKTAPQEDRP